jgi:uncharacterized integral membrane protein
VGGCRNGGQGGCACRKSRLCLLQYHAQPLHRLLMVQVFWGLGVLGGTYLALTQPLPLPSYVAENPAAVWLIGPAFAALTGVLDGGWAVFWELACAWTDSACYKPTLRPSTHAHTCAPPRPYAGVCFKEGLCYGKPEAFVLTGFIPILLLGHLSGVLAGDGERGLAAAVAALLAVFAARKYTQPVKDDIGDKSGEHLCRQPPWCGSWPQE